MLCCVLFNIFKILLGIGFCRGFDISKFTDYCGKTIISAAGELTLDAQRLPNYLPRDTCTVKIEIQSALFNSKTQALFYFTKFALGKLCKDANVTIIDGNPDRGTQIKGLPPFMCGHEEALENPDSVFITKSDELTVTFKRADYVGRFHGWFSITYVEFSTGACGGKDVHKCSNGRCIPKLPNNCSTSIACGENHTDCSNEKKPTTAITVIGSMLVFAVCVLVFCILGKLRRG